MNTGEEKEERAVSLSIVFAYEIWEHAVAEKSNALMYLAIDVVRPETLVCSVHSLLEVAKLKGVLSDSHNHFCRATLIRSPSRTGDDSGRL